MRRLRGLGFILVGRRAARRATVFAAVVGVGCSSSSPGTSPKENDGGASDAADVSHDGADSNAADAPGSSPRHLTGLPTGSWIEDLKFSSDGTVLWAASEEQIGGANGDSRAWTVSSGATLQSIPGPSWSISLEPSGSDIAIGGPAVTVFDPGASGVSTVRTLANASGAVAYSHDGKWIAAGDPTSGTVIIFSSADGSVVNQVSHPVVTNERLWRVIFSPDDTMLATASGQNGLGSPHGSTFVWKTADWSMLTQITCTTFDASFSSDNASLALACWLNAKIVSTSDWTVKQTIELAGQGEALATVFSPDNSKLAIGVFEGGVQIYKTADASSAGTLTDGKSGPTIKGLAWSPDGSIIAGGGWDDAIVRLWTAGF